MAKLYNENYIELKRKLDSLNYSIQFDMTSCKLIDTLVNDILKLKGEVTKSMTERESLKQKLEQIDLNFRALEYENKRLLRENNQLHQEMIELSKKLNFSSSAKDIEIKRLSDEKNDLKFLFIEMRLKFQKLEKENVKLKTRLSDMLVQIFDSNFSEQNLRKMFNEHVYFEVKDGNINTENDNLFDLNYELINMDKKKEKKENSDTIMMSKTNKDGQMLEITLPKRSINLNQVLESNQNFGNDPALSINNHDTKLNVNNQSNSNITPQNPYNGTQSNTNLDQALKSTFLKTADDLIIKATSSAINNEDNYKNLQKKNEYLQKQLEKLTSQLSLKNKEDPNSKELERITRKMDKSGGNEDIIVKFLKDENMKLTAKYEERINFMINENRKLQSTLTELSSHKPKVEKKQVINNDVYNVGKFDKKIKLLENQNKSLLSEITFLREKIERNEKNFDITKYVPKEMITVIEEKNIKLKDDYDKAQELVLKLNERIQNLLSSSNSEKVFLKNSIKSLNQQDEFKSNEKKQLNQKINILEDETTELSEKITNLNSLLSQKENSISKLNEFINSFEGEYEVLKKEKQTAINKGYELEKEMTLMRRNLNLKEGEIERLLTINNIFEKENQILKLKCVR